MYVCMCVHVPMYVCPYVCMYVRMYVIMYVCMYVCMPMRVYVHAFMYALYVRIRPSVCMIAWMDQEMAYQVEGGGGDIRRYIY